MKVKNSKKINLVSLANNEIKKQKLSEIKGGQEESIFPCACYRDADQNRSQGKRRNCTDFK